MKPRFNLWIEVEGELVLSLWRADLLKAIAATGSINAAAEQMGIPYRTAWQKVHEMEERLNVRLLETQTGGLHGGGARLTPAAEIYLEKLEQLYTLLTPMVDAAYFQVFGDSSVEA